MYNYQSDHHDRLGCSSMKVVVHQTAQVITAYAISILHVVGTFVAPLQCQRDFEYV